MVVGCSRVEGTETAISSVPEHIDVRENSIFGIGTNRSSVFCTENFELPYLAST